MVDLDGQICKLVRKLERSYGRGIYPFMVQAWLDMPRCEQSLRRDMQRMARTGKLVRVGGGAARRGYVMPVRGWLAC